MSHTPRVLFVCVENACRSQMAAGFARMHGTDRIEAFSAGSKPANAVNPRAVSFMGERGCDISAQIPKPLSAFADQAFDWVVTMGCGDACPWLPARHREDWALPDPKSLSDEQFRAVRDEIERRVQRLLSDLGASSPEAAS
ncbi:arsenate reductase ArsC [Dyella sp.]|jgi:protein-tyrosine-phosphatase|uniref:arsenate reductase ArsC n=1 Tax=Dyella sp. TaxID=1869338 RepID=UPI00238E55DE|nr:arsenate reductase ArsC [Xanthomonadaceae bacterium]